MSWTLLPELPLQSQQQHATKYSNVSSSYPDLVSLNAPLLVTRQPFFAFVIVMWFFFSALSLFRYTYTKNLLCLLFWAWKSWSIYFINVGILLNLTKKRSVLFIICNNFYFSKLNRAILLGGNSHKYLLIYQTASKVRVLTFEFRSLHHWAHECGN